MLQLNRRGRENHEKDKIMKKINTMEEIELSTKKGRGESRIHEINIIASDRKSISIQLLSMYQRTLSLN